MSKKPKCPLIGQDGNIFNLMGIASKTLKRNGMYDEAKEMCSRITSSGSYNAVIDPADNSCCFHIYDLRCFFKIAVILFAEVGR